MLSVAEARQALLGACSALDEETLPIERAYGRVLASPLIAQRDQPPFDASAMDGYACARTDTLQNLTIVGESAAGRAFPHALRAGEAIRISTGAPIPDGADGVLMQEDAQLVGDTLVGVQVARGRHIRPRGGDFVAGQLLLDRGRKLDPTAIALAASAGFATLRLVRRPRVTIIAGGDEIVPPGQKARTDQVYESGAFAICGLVERWGGEASRGAVLPDNESAIMNVAADALETCDLLVLIGGASVGPHDHARPALARLGVDILFDKVAVRPGKPTWFGVSPAGKVLGLPGNPASAIVCAMLFLRPALEAMLGRDPAPLSEPRHAPLVAPLPANGPRETYLRAHLGENGKIRVFGDQDSSLLSVFAQSNALVLRPPNAPAAPESGDVPYLSFE